MRGCLSVWQGPDQAEHDREEAEAVEEAEADHHGEHLSRGKFKFGDNSCGNSCVLLLTLKNDWKT